MIERLRIPTIKNIRMERKKRMNAVEKSGSRKIRSEMIRTTRNGGKNPL
jgi:hypothetical protein